VDQLPAVDQLPVVVVVDPRPAGDQLAVLQAENSRLRQERTSLRAHLAQFESFQADAENNATKLGQRLDAAVDSLKDLGVKDPLATTTAVPTVIVQNVTVPKEEYEDMILVGAILGVLCLCALPVLPPCRKRCETRFHRVYPCLVIVCVTALALVLSSLELIDFNKVFFLVVDVLDDILAAVHAGLLGTSVLVGAFVAWKFKDRILDSMGIERTSLVLGDFRDWATCWSMKRFQPIEIFIWKVEDLRSASSTAHNNIYADVRLGYNISMRTRVHHGAGHGCVFKESVQLNFDKYETESRMTLAVKHQGAVQTETIAQVQLGATQLDRIMEPLDREPVLGWASTANATAPDSLWADSRFHKLDLLPSGHIWLRVAPVQSEAEDEGLCGCCCSCCFPGAEESQGSQRLLHQDR